MLSKFTACEAIEHGSPDYCLFAHAASSLYRDSDFPRCVRHGRLISDVSVKAENKKEARKILDERFDIHRRPRSSRRVEEMTLDQAAKLLTGERSFSAYVKTIHEGYTPTIRLSNYKGKSRKAAKMVRAALHGRGVEVYPAYRVGE